MAPTSPVRRGCVPPHGLQSTPSTATTRIPFVGSFRNCSFASSSAESSAAVTGRSRHTNPFASRSTSASAAGRSRSAERSRSMVQVSTPRWNETVRAPSERSNAAERRCWP